MNIISWMFLGLLTGLMAKIAILDRYGSTWLSTITLSIMGALLGGVLHGFAQFVSIQLVISGLMISDIYFAVLGAFIAVFLYGLLLVSNL
jgi:uncharacterized membrane protein YeaQ/YmgE (transglycosylase-associated protein family)